jgi:hypothetical protein
VTISVATAVTSIALLAVLAARHRVAAIAARSPVAARLRAVYTLLAALLALRLLAGWWTATLPIMTLMLVAAWLPMATLRLIEELGRRHAPRPIKLFALGGALALSVLAVTLGLVWSAAAAWLLALYELGMLAAMVALLARGRGGLGAGERQTADTFLLALLLAIPLAATDFEALLRETPIRGGAFAALLLVLATARLAAGGGSPWRLLADLGLAAGAGGAGLVIAHAAQPDLPGAAAFLIAAGTTALACLLLVVGRSRLGTEATGLIAALARAPAGDADALIAAHPMLASGRMLGVAELAIYPVASVERLLAFPVVSASTGDAEARDAARELLDTYAATHLVRLSRTPPRLLAIGAGSLAAPGLDDELALAARLIEGGA